MFESLLGRRQQVVAQLDSSPVKVWTEFQQLEEVILGRAYPASFFSYLEDSEFRDQISKILEETEEDLQSLEKILEGLGVKVRRPNISFQLNQGSEPYVFDLQKNKFTFPNHPLMPRDTLFAYGDKIVESFTGSQGRFFENTNYYSLLMEYFKGGAQWVSMPVPLLEQDAKNYQSHVGNKILFHAANLLRCGKDIFYSQPTTADSKWSGKGTPEGLDWIKRQYPSAQFHPAPCQGHLDGKVALLKPGVLATWSRQFVPEKLKNWEIIIVDSPNPFPDEFNSLRKRRFYKEFVSDWLTEWIGYVDETVFDINMLSISENTVITNGYNKNAYQSFKQNGIEAIPWSFRHQYFWDGAIHCVTLDVRRKGELESYL